VGLHELTLRNFRLFEDYVFQPDPSAVTVLLSPNGSGKTSILEAVYALATAQSFRTSTAGDMVRTNAPLAEVHGVMFHQERRVQVDLVLTKGARSTSKRMLVNGQRPTSRASLSEVLPITIFTPEGVDVVRQGPEHRRTFLTTLLTDVNLATGEVVERFARVLQQRNALIRSWQGQRPTTAARSELDVWDEEFVTSAHVLVQHREATTALLAPLVSQYYQELAQREQRIEVRYERSWEGDLHQALQQAIFEDVGRGYTTIGPHRDDVALFLEGRDARRQASQGEQRSLALALRLAGHQLVQQQRGVDPLLLLDDVFSELDPFRSDRLLGLLPVGQTLVTTATPLPSSMTPAAIVDVTRM
jgi:DNA replication and repair protein RecF